MTERTLITSTHNPMAQSWRNLIRSRQARLEQGQFVAEGEHMVTEAIRSGRVSELIVAEDSLGRYGGLVAKAEAMACPVYLVSKHLLEAVADTRTPQGVFCVCSMPETARMPYVSMIAALENVQDPGNVGTVMRTMDAVGCAGVLLSRTCADAFSPKTLRASMGAVFRVPVWVADDFASALQLLKRREYLLLAGVLDGQDFYERPADPDRVCLLIGNEGQGLTPETAAMADLRVRLPMEGGAESLNAAVAGAIMAYDVLRRRREHAAASL